MTKYEWFKLDQKRPDKGQWCWIIREFYGGLTTEVAQYFEDFPIAQTFETYGLRDASFTGDTFYGDQVYYWRPLEFEVSPSCPSTWPKECVEISIATAEACRKRNEKRKRKKS